MEYADKLNNAAVLLNVIDDNRRYTDDAKIQAYQLIEKILNNIVKNPQVEKFKSIKRTNPTLQAKLFCIEQIQKLLEQLGFVNVDETMMFLSESEKDYQVLDAFILYLQQSVEKIKDKYISNEELERKKEIHKRQKEIEEEYRRKQEEEAKLKELMMLDRKEKAKDEKPKDSVACQREFGSKKVTYKDIGVDLNARKGG